VFAVAAPLLNKSVIRNFTISQRRNGTSNSCEADGDIQGATSFPSALLVSGKYASLQFRTVSPEISAGNVILP
jgi:hypothetical protein